MPKAILDILYKECQITERFIFEILIFTASEPFSAIPADTQVPASGLGAEKEQKIIRYFHF